MMNKIIKSISLALLFTASASFAAPEVGQPAPSFAMLDTNGESVDLSSLEGKTVVLEWTNHQCPYVRKHYDSENMQALQKEAVADDVVWISVLSSAPGKQGHLDADGANQIIAENGASPTHFVLDPTGELGQKYAAKTTPHMYVINASGELAYMGGIDDISSADPADIADAENYVRSALTQIKNGEAVSNSSTRPYGCGVKYSS